MPEVTSASGNVMRSEFSTEFQDGCLVDFFINLAPRPGLREANHIMGLISSVQFSVY
jgi:hypothetical protein